MTDDGTSLCVRVLTLAICVAVAGFVLYEAGVAVVEQREQRIEDCDERYGDDQWVFVEEDIPRWQRVLYLDSPPVECVSIDSPRAEDCVVGTTLAGYNDRCAEL